MSNKFFKFHYKNDKESLAVSYDVVFDDFSDAMKFAYDKLDELNEITVFSLRTPDCRPLSGSSSTR